MVFISMRKNLRQREEPEVSVIAGFVKYAIPLLWHSANPQKTSGKIEMETNAHISSSSPHLNVSLRLEEKF